MRHPLHNWLSLALLGLSILTAPAQVDPIARNQIQLGYDQFLSGHGPQAAYAYYYLNVPQLTRSNPALPMAGAPAYPDGELGIRGAALSLYQLLDPGQLVPLIVVARGGFRYTTYDKTKDTAEGFELPDGRMNLFTRAGLHLAGKEPVLYPDLGLELSLGFKRQWRSSGDQYGCGGDRKLDAAGNLYRACAALNYAWTDVGHRPNLAVRAGGSDNAGRFSTWRLGGVLPLAAEFVMVLPGYYYEEICAQRFVQLYGSCANSLDSKGQWSLRFEGASARADYAPDFEQTGRWNTGVGGCMV